MATTAMAQTAVFALRQEIAKIEGRLPEPLLTAAEIVRRHHGAPAAGDGQALLATGAASLDRALGGGIPAAALTELHGAAGRDGGALAGFALALAARAARLKQARPRPFLWIGIGQTPVELGWPYAPGIEDLCGLFPACLLLAQAARLADGLWIAEEAARLSELAAVILEVDGNPGRLDLTATRRLHRRAQAAGRPVFLLRHSAFAEPTAAPVRLLVAPAPAALRSAFFGPVADTIGHPAFTVTIGKSRTALPGSFILEWSPHDSAFQERGPENPRFVVPASAVGSGLSPAPGAVVALHAKDGLPAAGVQPPRKQHPAHRRARRTG